MLNNVTVEINNSTSKVHNLTTGQLSKLRKALSYSIDSNAAFFSGSSFNRIRYCIDKQGTFPTGLLGRVTDSLINQGVKACYIDHRAFPQNKVDHKPKITFTPYPAQVAAAEMAEKCHRTIISMPTGSGKSLVIAMIIARLNVRTLVVVPSLQIKEQMTDTLKGIFGSMANIVIENIDSGALKTAKGFDLILIDEAHHVAAKTYQRLNKTAWTGIYYRVFLTATPFRNRTEETMLFEGIAGDTVYKLSYKEAVSKKYIVPIEAYYIELPKVPTEAYTWAQVYSELVVNNQVRNEVIAEWILQLSLNQVSTLCLVKEINHGNKLEALTGVLFANGQDETTREFINHFNTGRIKSLIGTTGIIGEGVDTKPCEYVIIAGLGKAKSAFMQQVGRAVRTFPGKESGKIILIKDRSHKFLLRHYNEQAKILKEEYGVKPIKMEI